MFGILEEREGWLPSWCIKRRLFLGNLRSQLGAHSIHSLPLRLFSAIATACDLA
jgi:hypothetical protein